MKRILIVEDDQVIADLLTELLSSEGYEARQFLSPREALAYIKQEPPADLILLDLMMPELSGAEFRAEQLLLPTWARVPVVLMSAAADARQAAADMKAAGLLRKPFTLADAIKIIEKCAG